MVNAWLLFMCWQGKNRLIRITEYPFISCRRGARANPSQCCARDGVYLQQVSLNMCFLILYKQRCIYRGIDR